MSKLISIAFAALVAVLSTQAVGQSQTHTPQIDKRLIVAKDRVYDGIRTGRLTRSEADVLNRDIANVERMVARAKADGVATNIERQDIRDALARVERDIDRLYANSARR